MPREPAKLRELAVESVAADLECEDMAAGPQGMTPEAWKGKVAERVRGIHQAVELGLSKWEPWQREPFANLMIEELRKTTGRLWEER